MNSPHGVKSGVTEKVSISKNTILNVYIVLMVWYCKQCVPDPINELI